MTTVRQCDLRAFEVRRRFLRRTSNSELFAIGPIVATADGEKICDRAGATNDLRPHATQLLLAIESMSMTKRYLTSDFAMRS